VFVSHDNLADVPIERLEAAIASLASGLAARMERWLALVAEFDRREIEAVRWIDRAEVARMIQQQAIRDGLSLTALLLHLGGW
jgi:hypothetical protein